MVNLPNWLYVNFKPEDGEWLNLDTVQKIHFYEQHLNFHEGYLSRRLRVEDSKGRITTIASHQYVFMRKSHFTSVKICVIPENWSGKMHVKSLLDGSVRNRGVERYKGLVDKHLDVIDKGTITDDER
jgi:trehalose/maltose hydrolase-like predicted phosphorylase